MSTFTASNGVVIEDRGGSLFIGSTILFGAGSLHGPALVEYFRAKEDARLGRWRWPENPDYVVYRTDHADSVRVFRESDGIARHYNRTYVASGPFDMAGRGYFDAHPERKPLLLLQAQDVADVWVTLNEYTLDQRAHAEHTARLLESQDVPARVIEAEAA